ncbi:MAG TPA: glycosyltransferase family 87 protein [Candidatus Sulfotelmatobacter sp.]|nr:glycosyltransferase family 87 protein [Candidatus Sulfotelmatobacter sp.]
MYGWNLATPGLRDRSDNLKGTDFLHLYTLGSLAEAHRGADLYDMNAQTVLARQRLPEAAGIRYLPLYPPQVSMLFAPLARLSYGWALALWWGCSVALYGICCYGVWRVCSNLQDHGGLVMLLAAGFPAFFHLVAWGQTSALALACFTIMFFLLRARREFLAGLALGCLIFKPQLGVAAAVLFISLGSWRVVAGAVLSSAAELSAAIFYYGVQPLWAWLAAMRNAPSAQALLEPRPYQTHSLRTFWNLLFPWDHLAFGLYVLSAAAVLGLTIAIWKRGPSRPLALRYSALLLASVLVAPHLTVYDLVILAPGILLLADWLVGQPPSSLTRSLGTILYLIYALPLLGPLARWTHVQLSVVAMAAGVYVIWRIRREDVPASAVAKTA